MTDQANIIRRRPDLHGKVEWIDVEAIINGKLYWAKGVLSPTAIVIHRASLVTDGRESHRQAARKTKYAIEALIRQTLPPEKPITDADL